MLKINDLVKYTGVDLEFGGVHAPRLLYGVRGKIFCISALEGMEYCDVLFHGNKYIVSVFSTFLKKIEEE